MRWTRFRGEPVTVRGLASTFHVPYADLESRIYRGEDAEAALRALGIVLPPADVERPKSIGRPARTIELRGVVATIREHAARAGVSYWAAHGRLKRGASAERAFAMPRAEIKRLVQRARESGMNLQVVRSRLLRGWSAHAAFTTPTEGADEVDEIKLNEAARR